MAVIRHNEISRTGSVDDQNHRTYTRVMQVYTDDKTDGPIEISNAIPIVLWVSYYSVEGESDPFALAKSVDVAPMDGEQFAWTYTVKYDTRPFDQGSIANPTAAGGIGPPPGLSAAPSTPSAPSPPGGDSPSVRPWSLKYGVEQTQHAAPSVDRTGKNVRASNGQPYTGLQYDVAIPFVELTIPRSTCNRTKPAYYVNTTNNDTFLGYAPGTLRCTGYDITSQFEQQWGYYFEISLKFQIRPEGHGTLVLDEGTFWKDGFDLKKNQDKWSNPIDGSVLLDGAGGKLAGGPPVTNSFLFYQSTTYADIL